MGAQSSEEAKKYLNLLPFALQKIPWRIWNNETGMLVGSWY